MAATKQPLLSFLAVFSVIGYVSAQTDLYFSFMLSQSSDGVTSNVEQDTSGAASAVAVALDAINNESSILEGYRLIHSDVLNSQCERSASLDAFFTDITTQPTKVFLLGCGCSIATAPVGEISQFWEIVQLAYASLTPIIRDRSSFPNVYSVLPSALSYKDVIIALMNTYGWNRLAVISQLENEFNQLRESLEGVPGLEVASKSFHSSSDIGNMELFTMLNDANDDYRVFFLNMYEKQARRVICKAYLENRGIHYPRYTFIVPGTYHDKWWKYTSDINCTEADMKTILDRSLVIATYPTAGGSNETDVVLTYDEFYSRYEMELSFGEVATFAAPFAYDALWAMAYAMNRSNESLLEFDNRMNGRRITSSFKKQLNNLEFIGVTGPVSFDMNGTRREMYPRVLQYRLLNDTTYAPVLIGVVINSSTADPILEYVEGESNETVWPDIVPFDGSPLVELRGVLLGVFTYLYVFATIGVILCIACAIINFVLRNKKVIRLTSPNLNYLIIFGCFLMIISTYFFAYPYADYDVLYSFCVIRAYTQNVGYMLCFGTVCAKMGRVYFIFHNTSPNRKRKSIQDWHLVLVVIGLSMIDIIIATVSLIVDDYKPREEIYTEQSTDVNEFGITINIRSLNCSSDTSIIWIGMLFVTKAIVQLIAVFFAFTTRKVKIKALNDAKTIAIIIYVTTGILTILLITAIVFANLLNTDAGVFGSLLVIFACTILLMLFIPKWYNLYKDPEGKNIFEGNTQNTFGSTNAGGGGAISEQELSKLVNRIEELEERLGRHEAVTPSQPRRRFLSSTGDISRNTGTPPSGMQGLRAAMAARGGGRSMSYSPTPVDTTASLPPKMLQQYSPAPISPLAKTNNTGYDDSGASTMNSTMHSDQSGESPPMKPPVISLTIEEADNDESHVHNLLTSSQTPLTASTNF